MFYILFFNNFVAFAQETGAVDNSPDFLRSMGKMYVVIAVIAVIFLGIIIFLINIDRKISKLEKDSNL